MYVYLSNKVCKEAKRPIKWQNTFKALAILFHLYYSFLPVFLKFLTGKIHFVASLRTWTFFCDYCFDSSFSLICFQSMSCLVQSYSTSPFALHKLVIFWEARVISSWYCRVEKSTLFLRYFSCPSVFGRLYWVDTSFSPWQYYRHLCRCPRTAKVYPDADIKTHIKKIINVTIPIYSWKK